MNSNILYLNLFVVFILLLIIVATLMSKKENLKATLTFCFFFLNIIITCTNNLIIFYFGYHKLIFLQISLAGMGLLYGPMLLQYTYFLLDIKLPKFWWINYVVVLLVCISGLYYLTFTEETQKIYLKEMIEGEHVPSLIINVLILVHSIFYFIYVKLFLNKLKVNPNHIKIKLKKQWASNFVNYILFCNCILILYYILALLFFPNFLVFGDLVIMPLIVLIIYTFIIIKSAQQQKEAEYKYALSKVKSQNKLLQQRLSISRDLHDNIGSQLTFIISSIDIIKLKFNIIDSQINDKLNVISDFAQKANYELRDTVWALNTNEVVFEDIESRINSLIHKASIVMENIAISFTIDEKIKSQKLTSIECINVFRTIQEAIHNSYKHSGAKSISIHVLEFENRKLITINDDGIGFDVVSLESGNGLKNMKKRIQQIGGQFDLTSNPQGTKIRILI